MGRIVEEPAGRTYVYGDGDIGKYGLIVWRSPSRYDVYQFYRSGRTIRSWKKTKEAALEKLKKFVSKVK